MGRALGQRQLTAAGWTDHGHLVSVVSSSPILTRPPLNVFFKNVPEARGHSQPGNLYYRGEWDPSPPDEITGGRLSQQKHPCPGGKVGEKSSCLWVPRCLPGDYRVGATVVPLCWSPAPLPGCVGLGVCRRPETGRVHGAAAPGAVAGPPALPRLLQLRLKRGAARFRGLPGLSLAAPMVKNLPAMQETWV